STITHGVGSEYIDAGASATDNTDGSVNVTSSGSVDSNNISSYTITYTASDAAGNESSLTRIVNVTDITPPEITLTGETVVTVNFPQTYIEQGAIATDDVDTDVTIITTGTVNTAVVGTYTLNYSATDAAGNTATPITRTVTVVDVTAPVITLTGEPEIIYNYGDVYVDAGATATDDVDPSIEVTNDGETSVVTDMVNTYTVTYTATDLAGNSSTLTREITIQDIAPPVITLNGGSTILLGQGREYRELGATALDNADGETIVAAPTGTIDPDTIGDYLLTYTVTDSSNNTSTAERTVSVVEPRPFITRWKTDNEGISDDNTIIITTRSTEYAYNYSV
ncbi:immunoglobulin-like domain-containing protein, partial [Colwellia echini]